MHIPADLRYTKTHEWAKREGSDVIIGITSHAQEELRDIVFLELPKVGRTVKQGESVAVIESVKAAFDIYAPVSGTVIRVNDAVANTPQIVNQDCYEVGWLLGISPSLPDEWSALLSAEEYSKQIQAQTH